MHAVFCNGLALSSLERRRVQFCIYRLLSCTFWKCFDWLIDWERERERERELKLDFSRERERQRMIKLYLSRINDYVELSLVISSPDSTGINAKDIVTVHIWIKGKRWREKMHQVSVQFGICRLIHISQKRDDKREKISILYIRVDPLLSVLSIFAWNCYRWYSCFFFVSVLKGKVNFPLPPSQVLLSKALPTNLQRFFSLFFFSSPILPACHVISHLYFDWRYLSALRL